MMNIDIKKIVVKYNLKTVGYLAELENRRIAFQYDEKWVKDGFSISPFSLPLSDKVYISTSNHFDGLYGVFNDSLPDGWGELLVRRMLAKNGINFDKLSPLTKLTLLSQNGLGGLNYEPIQVGNHEIENFDLDYLSDEIKKLIDDISNNYNLDYLFEFGGSSGGARPKAHIRFQQDDWIIKFPASMDPKNMGSLEYDANLKAQKSGIKVNEFKLFPSKRCEGYFGVKRFDRIKDVRIHMISLSALLETSHRIPNLDYMHLFQVIQKIAINQDDLYEAYRRMCFNVLFQNKDDHGKNFAFLYDEQKKGYVLSPAYDLTKTPNKLEHEMTVLGEGRPRREDLISMAKALKLSIQKCMSIIQKIEEEI